MSIRLLPVRISVVPGSPQRMMIHIFTYLFIYLYIMYKCSCFFLQYHSHVRLPQNPDAEVYSQLPLITSY